MSHSRPRKDDPRHLDACHERWMELRNRKMEDKGGLTGANDACSSVVIVATGFRYVASGVPTEGSPRLTILRRAA